MLPNIYDFINQIKRLHNWSLSSVNNLALIDEFQNTKGVKFPRDLTFFYQQFSEVSLFDERYRILPISEISLVSEAIFADSSDDYCSSYWYTVCDVNDGNYVGIDLSSSEGTHCNILDCYHEDVPECNIIAKSFSEFMEKALASGGELYWLEKGFQNYGTTKYNHPKSYFRRIFTDFWNSLGDEIGPDFCATPSCLRKRIKWSIMCKKHHFEMVYNRECPFEE